MSKPTTEEKSALLGALPLFASLSRAECLALAAECVWSQWPKGQSVFHEGEKAHGMHIVLQGLVKVFHSTADGRERVLHLIRPGHTCGEAAVFQRGTYPAHAATLAPTTALYVPAEALLNLLAGNPDVALRMLAALALRLRMFTRKLEAHGKGDSGARLAAYLLHRIRISPAPPAPSLSPSALPELTEVQPLPTVHLEVSREILANMLGIARETLSRTFSRLQQQGVVRLSGREVCVLDEYALQELAEAREKP